MTAYKTYSKDTITSALNGKYDGLTADDSTIYGRTKRKPCRNQSVWLFYFIDYKAKTPSDRNRGGEKSDDALAL